MKKNALIGLSVFLFVTALWPAVGLEAAPAQKPMEIIFAASLPAQAPVSQCFIKRAEAMEQRSGGRVKFVYYWSNTLLPAAEAIKGLRAGVADMSQVWAGTQDYMPLTYNIMYMPFVGYPSMKQGSIMYSQLYDKFPALRDEFAGLKRLTSRLFPPTQLHTAKKAVKEPSDLKGMKIAVVGGGKMAMLLKSMGAAPVDMPVGEINLALSTGVVEGWAEHLPAVMVFGGMPKVPYHTILGEGGMSMALQSLVMSAKTFGRLPPDVQRIFEEEGARYGLEAMEVDEGEIQRATNAAKEMKHTFINLSPQEVQAWAEHATEIHQQWVTEMESKGKPAKAIYEEAKRLIKEGRK